MTPSEIWSQPNTYQKLTMINSDAANKKKKFFINFKYNLCLELLSFKFVIYKSMYLYFKIQYYNKLSDQV